MDFRESFWSCKLLFSFLTQKIVFFLFVFLLQIMLKLFFQHKINLILHPHVLITNLSVVVDPADNETYPTRFSVFVGNSKNVKRKVNEVMVQANQSTVQLLDCQEEVDLIFTLLMNSSYGETHFYSFAP